MPEPDDPHGLTDVPGRHESPQQRADRNFTDLLQELRVTENGVQILFSLLLTLPFSNRFDNVTTFQRRVYLTALLLSGGAIVVLVAPVAYHRLLFHRGVKPQIVQAASRFAVAGLVLLLLAMVAVLLLIGDVLFSNTLAVVLAGGFGAATVVLWFVPPLLQRLRRP